MNNETKKRVILEKLKDEKEDLRFEISKILDYFIAIIIGLATVGVSVMISVPKSLAFLPAITFIIFMFLAYIIFFKPLLKDKGEKYKSLKNNVECEYCKLLGK